MLQFTEDPFFLWPHLFAFVSWSNLYLRKCFASQQPSCSNMSKNATIFHVWHTEHSGGWNLLMFLMCSPFVSRPLGETNAILTVDLLSVFRDGHSHGDGCSNSEGSAERTQRRRDAAGDGQVPFCVLGQGLTWFIIIYVQYGSMYWSRCGH